MPAPLPDSRLEQAVRRWQSERRLPSVSAAVFRRGEVLWQAAVGLADAGSGVDATPDTQYRVGSITKTFTAVAVLQLRDAGELSLEDALADHLPEARHVDATVRGLLAHVSGLQREPPGEIWESLEDPTVEELLARLPDAERVLPPGAYWHYSNLAYALLGELVARRSGMPAAQFVERRIIRPLGLARTTWLPVEPHAQGYAVDPFAGTLTEEPHVELRAGAAVGQLWSTTTDLARWGTVLVQGEPGVLEPRTAEELRAFQAMVPYVEGWRLGWGLGVQLFRDGDRILVGHGGAMPGFLAGLAVGPSDGIGAVALTNAGASGLMEALAVELARTAAEHAPAEPEEWRPEAPPPPEVAELLGRWWSEGVEYVFSWRRNRLQATLADPPRTLEPTEFEPEGDGRFRARSGLERGELLRVVRRDDGTVEKLYWATYPFTREPRPFGVLDGGLDS